MAIAVDASTPAIKGQTAVAGSIVSNSFSPPAGSVIFVVVEIDGTGAVPSTVSSMTDSLGSHLTYAQRVGISSANVRAEVWWASCPSAQVGMTVTANLSTANSRSAISPIVFTGGDSVQNGAVGSAQSASGTPSASLTTTRNGSWVLGGIVDFSSDHTPTIPGGQTDVWNGNTHWFSFAAGGEGAWTQGSSAATATSGTAVTINDTAPAAIDYAEAIAEVLAAATTLPPRVVVVDTAVARSTNY